MDKLLTINAFSLQLGSGLQRKTILEDIMFEITRGHIHALVGTSGSGKSMLAKSILGLFEQLEDVTLQGSINFKKGLDSIDVLSADSPTLRALRNKDVGIIFQQTKESFNPAFTMGRQLEEKLIIGKQMDTQAIRQKVFSVLAEVGLRPAERFYQAYPYQLSGGEIQRALIAMAFINDPELLIADEPCSALDYDLKSGIITLLQEINQKRQLSMLLITHDLALVAAISHHISIISKAKIVESGEANSVMSAPQSVAARALIACIPIRDYKVSQLATIADFENGEDDTPQSFNEAHRVSNQEIDRRKAMLQANELLLEVKDLHKSYLQSRHLFKSSSPNLAVINDLSFHVKKGEIFGLLGPSGSGKSTLARMIAGLEWADKGHIYFDGQDINSLSEAGYLAHQKNCQYIFQDAMSAMAPHVTVSSILSEVLTLNGQADTISQCLKYLAAVGLDERFLIKLPRHMSGGERQRVMIARALVFNPTMLICDEILSALDISNQAQIINLLLSLNRNQNLTILFITHDEPMLHFLCDRQLRLNPLVL